MPPIEPTMVARGRPPRLVARPARLGHRRRTRRRPAAGGGAHRRRPDRAHRRAGAAAAGHHRRGRAGRRRRGEPHHRRRPRRRRRRPDDRGRARGPAGWLRLDRVPAAAGAARSTRTPPSPTSPSASPTSASRRSTPPSTLGDGGRRSSSPASGRHRLLRAGMPATPCSTRCATAAAASSSTPRPARRTCTTAEAEAWAIREPVGGTRAWPESRAGEVGPGFTTFHAAGEARVTNIHRIADLVRGAVIPPGGTFSVNDYVGRRTRRERLRRGRRHPQRPARERGRRRRVAVRHDAVQRRLLRRPRHPRVPGPLRVLLPLPAGPGGDDGLPRPRPRHREHDAVRRPDLDLVHGHRASPSRCARRRSSPPSRPTSARGSSGDCDVVTTERTRTYPDGSPGDRRVPGHLPARRGPVLLSGQCLRHR